MRVVMISVSALTPVLKKYNKRHAIFSGPEEGDIVGRRYIPLLMPLTI